MEQSTLDLMRQLLLPFIKANTAEFRTFYYAIDSYIKGDQPELVEHLSCLFDSSNRKIAENAHIVVRRALDDTF